MNGTARLLATLLATWFGCGYFPKGPGTAGSVAAVAIALALYYGAGLSAPWFALLGFAISVPGIWAAGVLAHNLNIEDPQIVVIDEVAGQWIAIAGATVLNWKSWLLAFLLFRFFDIWKPVPIRNAERLPGGLGIVADDLIAGVWGALVIFVAGYFHLY